MTDVNINRCAKFAGFYTIRKYKKGSEILLQEVGPFNNAITNIGLNRVGTNAAVNTCYIGSGTAAGSTTDTAMGAQLASTNVVPNPSATTRGGAPDYWVQDSTTFRFNAATSSMNITEVGVGWATSSTNALWSRSRVVDSGGSPVTITLLTDEILDVTYSLRYYPDLTDSTYVVNISGVNYTINSRAANVNSFGVYARGNFNSAYAGTVFGGPCVLSDVTANGPTGSTSNAGLASPTLQTYVDGSLTRTSVSTAGITQSNVTGGITGIRLNQPSGTALLQDIVQMVISPSIPKDNTKSMTLTFSHSWSRY